MPEKSAAELESRSLTNAALKVFLEKNLHREIADWPHPRWDFEMLTLAAFYYQPDLAVARSQWNTAQAGIKTAGGRPNPTLSLVPGYDTTHHAGLTPWFPLVSFDLPLETMGKRGKRIDAAEHLSDSARFAFAAAAWKVRSDLRSALLDASATQERVALQQAQVSAQDEIVRMLQQQADAGAISGYELTAARVTLQKSRLDLADAQTQMAEARAREAEAIGIPLRALDDAETSFDLLKDPLPPIDLTTAEVRRAALTNRADVLGALADFAAAQADLQLEIAKQYPDVHLNPGYQFDQGDNKWSLGLTFDLPILNQNQGPIAEARARREEAAAKFNAVQSKVLAEIERAVGVFHVTESNSEVLRALATDQNRQRESLEAQFRAGAVSRFDVLGAQAEMIAAELARLDGELKLRQAFGALEDAVQRPMDLPNAARAAIDSKTP